VRFGNYKRAAPLGLKTGAADDTDKQTKNRATREIRGEPPAKFHLPSSIFHIQSSGSASLRSLWLMFIWDVLFPAPKVGANFVHLFAEVEKPDVSEWSTQGARFR
jgi:hypothetical protein